MERFKEHAGLKEAWTYDHISYKNLIGSIRDPYVITTESGAEMVPASIVYMQDAQGTKLSRFTGDAYKKVLFEYSRADEYLHDEAIGKYIVVDEEAEAAIIALPITGGTIYCADESLNAFMSGDTPESSVAKRFATKFPQIKFGIFGSQALFSEQFNSDIDLFVYGCKNFARFQKMLREEEMQSELGLEPITKEEAEFNSQRFAEKFKVPLTHARRLSDLRCRYRVKVKSGSRNVSFSAASDLAEFKNMSILGTKKLGKFEEDGRVQDADYATGFPRVYKVEVGGELLDVVSMHWSFRALAYVDQKVHIRGTRRERDSFAFISLEKDEDRLLME